MRILVVEDEPNIHHFITAILKKDYLGVEIDVAETGDAAIARYKACGPYDLVITDYMHPRSVSADELVRAIRTSNPEQPIILQTGNSGDHIDAFIQRWKDIPYLAKPWQVKSFRDLVKKMVG